MSIDIETRGDVRIVRWDDGENRVNVDSMTEWHAALDQLEEIEGPLAVVVIGSGKYFSNGLDLDRFAIEPDEAVPTVELLHARCSGACCCSRATRWVRSTATRSRRGR